MKKSIKPIISIFTIITFLGGMMLFSILSSCSSSKKSTRVHSGSGMGNKKQKNKHVWGK
ncbi:MAG: hypothetical protein HND54_04955 [Bacteroidetes bacterium]|nr:hypothetical protein [Flavobacteriales bacterium]NOG57065.1 hypothetical protein [Bacteroidota bacterium]